MCGRKQKKTEKSPSYRIAIIISLVLFICGIHTQFIIAARLLVITQNKIAIVLCIVSTARFQVQFSNEKSSHKSATYNTHNPFWHIIVLWGVIQSRNKHTNKNWNTGQNYKRYHKSSRYWEVVGCARGENIGQNQKFHNLCKENCDSEWNLFPTFHGKYCRQNWHESH